VVERHRFVMPSTLLVLTDIDATQGSILFGGVDSSRYTGDLVNLPIQDYPGTNIVGAFFIKLTGLAVIDGKGKAAFSVKTNGSVLLDSGSAASYLPDGLADDIAQTVGAQLTSDGSAYVVDCSIADSGATLKFRFGSATGPIITAQISQFVLPVGQGVCIWGIFRGGEGPFVFGDTFLRSAYVVYNIDGESVAIANTNFDPSESNIQPITDPDSIPGAIPL
jgi:Eukaryotic aspartyl protease